VSLVVGSEMDAAEVLAHVIRGQRRRGGAESPVASMIAGARSMSPPPLRSTKLLSTPSIQFGNSETLTWCSRTDAVSSVLKLPAQPT
jgi:hypothetical protein